MLDDSINPRSTLRVLLRNLRQPLKLGLALDYRLVFPVVVVNDDPGDAGRDQTRILVMRNLSAPTSGRNSKHSWKSLRATSTARSISEAMARRALSVCVFAARVSMLSIPSGITSIGGLTANVKYSDTLVVGILLDSSPSCNLSPPSWIVALRCPEYECLIGRCAGALHPTNSADIQNHVEKHVLTGCRVCP